MLARALTEPTYDGTELKSPGEGLVLFVTDVELDFQVKPPTQ